MEYPLLSRNGPLWKDRITHAHRALLPRTLFNVNVKYLLRPAIAVIAIILLLDALFLIVRGVMLTYYRNRTFRLHPNAEPPFLHALEASALFFLAFYFNIMAIGLVQLFVGGIALLRIGNFTDLKLLLWNSFLLTILVIFVTHLIREEEPDWEILILPSSILLLSISGYLIKKR